MSIQELLSANMKRLRKKKEMTQADLAEKSGVSTTFIAEIETNKKFPSPKKLEDIASALDVEPFELIMPLYTPLSLEDKKHFSMEITSKMRALLDEIENDFTSDEND